MFMSLYFNLQTKSTLLWSLTKAWKYQREGSRLKRLSFLALAFIVRLRLETVASNLLVAFLIVSRFKDFQTTRKSNQEAFPSNAKSFIQ